MSVLWEPCGTGARVLRVFGGSPCPVVPAAVDGRPVTEIGPYCFAAREAAGGALWPPDAAADHAVCGDFPEEIVLPDSVRVLHSAAFYNCRRLRRVEVGTGPDALGSDLFTNCRALAVFALRAAPGQATGLRRLLGAVSADVGAVFLGAPGARLFFPEYFEYLDENTPAHIFNHSIEGEGYRLRQCFNGGAVDFAAYDAAFALCRAGESAPTLCRIALGRLLAPFALGDAARAAYEAYLRERCADAFALAAAQRDGEALRLLVRLGCPRADASALCARLGWSEGAALLLSAPHRAAKKRYDFDD